MPSTTHLPIHPPPDTAALRMVASKLVPRMGTARPLARPRLTEQWLRAGPVRLVLVRAPAGFGKSTFMAEHARWLQQQGTATAWLALDEADNDVSRFIAYLVAAFQAIDPALALVSATRPQGQEPGHRRGDIDGAALDLVHHLSRQTAPFVVFLDNLELIQDPAVLGVLRMLLEALPPAGQLVVGSRDTPDLGLGRLRAHGHLLELGPTALRFSFEEACTLLQVQCELPVSKHQVQQLLQRTEGWAAALWLAAVSLRERSDADAFIHSFSGSDAAVADYLLEDVLSRQPAERRAFLLATSVLDELHPALCDHLTGRLDSRERLAELERAGLFVLPQSPDRSSYRCHALFRNFLYAQLQQTTPDTVAGLHLAAATWHQDHDQPVQAIEQTIRSGDTQRALAALARFAEPLLWHGRVRLLLRFFERVPAATAPGASPALQLTHAWALTLTRRYREALVHLDRLDREADAGELPGEVRTGSTVLRNFALAMSDQAAQALQQWHSSRAALLHAPPFLRGIQHNSYAFCLIAASRFDEAQQVLAEGRESHQRIHSLANLSVAACLEGEIALARGRVLAAVSRFRATLAMVNTAAVTPMAGGTITVAFLAEALYHHNELAEAETLLGTYLPLLKDAAAPDQMVTSHVTLARLARLRGDMARAAELLTELELIGENDGLPRLAAAARLERARMALLDGDTNTATAELQRADDPLAWGPVAGLSMHASDVESLGIGRLRLMLHLGQASQALALLQPALAEAEDQQRLRRVHTLRILGVKALQQLGRHNEAEAQWRQVQVFAQANGLLRAATDEGMEALGSAARSTAVAARALAMSATGGLGGTGDTGGIAGTGDMGGAGISQATVANANASPSPSPTSQALPPGGSLSAKEQRILLLLAEGLGNRDIAQRLFVSESTVKTHLKHINHKLGADNRTHAVAVARRLGLL